METAPEATAPEETAPVETAPEEKAAEQTAPEEKAPEEKAPQENWYASPGVVIANAGLRFTLQVKLQSLQVVQCACLRASF